MSEEDLGTLLELLYDVVHKWERIATFLNLDQGAIANIKSSGTAEAEDKLLEVMKKWLSRTSPVPTVRILVDVLRKRFIGGEKAALEVERHFTLQSFSKSL